MSTDRTGAVRLDAGSINDLGAGTLSALGRLLLQHDPARTAALTRAHPELEAALAGIKVLGTETAEAAPADRLRKGLMEMARLGIRACSARVERLSATLPRRARLAKRLKLVGGVISALSSAGVVSALALAQTAAALVSACLSLVTSVTALIGEHIESPLFGTRKSLGELLTEMLAIEQEIRDAEIALLEAEAVPDGAVAAVLARTINGIAARLRVLEVIEGIAPANR